MKYEIDSLILEATKTLITSSIATLKDLYNREQSFDKKVMLEATINCLRQAYNNLEGNANKPKPIRKIGITSK